MWRRRGARDERVVQGDVRRDVGHAAALRRAAQAPRETGPSGGGTLYVSMEHVTRYINFFLSRFLLVSMVRFFYQSNFIQPVVCHSYGVARGGIQIS